MNLLVTRPILDAERTASRLRAMGHIVVVRPLLRVEFLPLIIEVDPAAIVVTSRNAVRAIGTWKEVAAWWDRPLFAVGAATASAAVAAGFKDVRAAEGDGAALARLVSGSPDPAGGSVLYPAAEDRSLVMEEMLRAEGFDIEIAVAYRMTAAEGLGSDVVEALRSGALAGILLYSKRSAATFLSLVDKSGLTGALQQLRIFALSPTIASIFAGRAVGRIDVAAAPREDALLSLIPPGTSIKALDSETS